MPVASVALRRRSLAALGGEPLRTLLDAEHHLSLHDQRRGLHREHADTARRCSAGETDCD